MKKFIGVALWLVLLSVTTLHYYGQIKVDYPFGAVVTPVKNVYSDLAGYDDILALQKAFVRNAKTVKPVVVGIHNLREIPSKAFDQSVFTGTPGNWVSNIQRWLNHTLRKRYQVESRGSGIIYDYRGHILTNYHVVAETEKILVKLSDGREFNGQLVGADPKTNLAVLKIFSFSSFTTPAFGNSSSAQVGDWVMAIGNPFGLDGTVTVGVISGIHRSNLGIATFESFIQTDASINPGNSGGPLINLDGKIIGINTAIAEIGAGVGFAIPINMAIEVAEELIENGSVQRGWLGMEVQPLTPELADSFNITPSQSGVVVNRVDQGSPAEKAGIRHGDIIINYDGKETPDLKSIQSFIADSRVGKSVAITILRNGFERNIRVEIGKHTS